MDTSEGVKLALTIQLLAYFLFSPLLCLLYIFPPTEKLLESLSELNRSAPDYFLGFIAGAITVFLVRKVIFNMYKNDYYSAKIILRFTSIIVVIITVIFIIINLFEPIYNMRDEVAISIASLLYFLPHKH